MEGVTISLSFGLQAEEDVACDLWKKVLAVRQYPSNRIQFCRTVTDWVILKVILRKV